MNKLHLDFETRSRVDLKKAGAWAYAAHPSTEIVCMAVAVNEAKVLVLPREYVQANKEGSTAREAMEYGARIIAHNAQFEYAISYFILHKRFGWPAILDPSRWDCTMARAYACGLPGSLEGAAMALNLPHLKDIEGKAIMMRLCRPKADGTFEEDAELHRRNREYCGKDVETERGLDRALPELSDSERKVFELDLVMNRRGLPIDVRSCEKAAAIADDLTVALNKKLKKITDGACSAASKIAELKRWIVAQGVAVPTKVVDEVDENGELTQEEKETLDKEAVAGLIARPEIPLRVKNAISIRAQVGKSSTSKFRAMLASLGADWRIRGTFQYHGAHTGRVSGRLIQPQNYPQGLTGAAQEQAVALLDDPALFTSVYGDKAMQTLSDILRGMLQAPTGKVFVGADYNAIECRVLNWLAEERWVLDLFGRGETPYIPMAEKIFNRRGVTKKDAKEYDIGKRAELGCGFGMGWIKFQSTVRTQTANRDGVAVEIPDTLAQKAVKVYRETHQRVVSMWYAMEHSAVNAVLNPGKSFSVCGGRVMWKMSQDGKFLMCRLPSGRLLRYFRPTVRVEPKFGKEAQCLYYWTAAGPSALKTECNGYLGWYRTWGGELVENVVQAVARDIMMHGALNAEAVGFPLVMSVHDELVAEIPEDDEADLSNAQRFAKAMCDLPDWAKTCPITAPEDGRWIGRRYRK